LPFLLAAGLCGVAAALCLAAGKLRAPRTAAVASVP
jgi:hypothetical protein